MSGQVLSESRFYMWRAVFAMAHVDGTVTDEEIAFAEQYLGRAPFSAEQVQVLSDDLRAPKSVGEMLGHVSEPSDQADFFQFSQMLAWADGDYSAQEKALVERMSAEQMNTFNKAEIAQNIRNARKAAILRRALEDEEFAAQARDVSGFANVVRYIAPWMDAKGFEAPDAEMFKLWRAVFSLVHVDGEVSPDEREYIDAMMDVFHFSAEQRGVVEGDLKAPGDVVSFFKAITSVQHRRQFFVMARTIVWCDGVFHDDERAALETVKAALGSQVSEYESEIRFMDRKPALPEGSNQESMMQGVVRQMVDFYKENLA